MRAALHAIDLPVFAAYDQSDNLQWIFLFNPTLSGDFDHVSADGMNYMTMAGARYKRARVSNGYLERFTARI